MGFPGGSVVKNLPASAGNAGLIPGLGKSLEEGMATYSSILPWEIPQAEEHDWLQPMELQRVRHDWAAEPHTSVLHMLMNISQCYFLNSSHSIPLCVHKCILYSLLSWYVRDM